MNRKQLDILPYLLSGVFFFTYVTTRVFTIPITIDEAWTLYSFVRHPVWDIITIKNPSTNNHVLNTLLARLTTVFSEKEFFLRLPNLLSFPLYVYGSYLLSRLLINNKLLAFAMFITLLTNYTLLDFFGLCRGYGLSIGLFTLSISYLIKIAKGTTPPRKQHVHIILLSAIAAFYANIAVLHVMVALIIITSFILYRHRNGQPVLSALRLPMLYTLIISLLGGIKLWKQYKQDEIFYGGQQNFIDDTLAGMMSDYTGLFFFKEHHVWIMNITVALLSLAILVHILSIRRQQAYFFIPFSILMFSLLMTHIQFYLLDVPLPINRIALFFYPLMVLTLFVALQMLSAKVQRVAIVIGLGVALFSMWRFGSEMNITRMNLWWIDMYSKQVVQDIAKDHSGKDKARVFANWPTDNTVNYYINIYYKDELVESPCCTRFADLKSVDSFDYIYMHVSDDENAFPGLTEIGAYHVDGSLILYRNDGKPGKQ